MNMSRLAPYLGIVAAFAFFSLIVIIANEVPVPQPISPSTPTASSTLSVEQGFVLPPITLPDFQSATSTSAAPSTSSSKKVSQFAPKSTPALAPVPAPRSVAPTVAQTNAALDVSAISLRDALVNIICFAPEKSGLHSISGSGVLIDPKGIILTNAHIAQYFLLADRGARCFIRVGSPAADAYEASLIYISPSWLKANADVLTQTVPIGTGEYDFAFLAVTKSITSSALPVSFPALPLATMPRDIGTPVAIATYGAQFLEASQIQSGLFPTVVFGSVKDVFTFDTNTIDVFALGGSAAAQEGSSGGGVVDVTGQMVGTITTSTVTGTTDKRSLDAITASYIRAEYANETGKALDLLLARPTSTSIADFAPQIPVLGKIVTAGFP
ncbi:MAG: serine protease [Patescibacteria group bacterium]|nr:serine protease [Patescibacteria group bacterium]